MIIILIFAGAAAVAMAFTAGMRVLAPRLQLTDRPDGHRKLHRQATPLGGGAAVLAATVAVVLALLVLPNRWQAGMREMAPDLVSLLMAGMVIVAIGLVDDRVQLRGRQKLLGQLIAIAILIYDGLVIQRIAMFGYHLDLGLLAIPFTTFWLLGAVNAMNLLDGLDGLASMLGMILVGTFAGVAALTGRPEVALIALVFAGSLAGFLRYNFPPASIFLGDAGSMLIGLVVGALAVHGSLKGPGTVLLAAPLAVWTLPILDSAAALLRRRLTGRSIFATDRAHLHHRLMERLGTNRRVLALVALCCLATSAGALCSVAWNNDLIAAVVCVGVVVMLAACGIFGHTEAALLRRRMQNALRTLLPAGENGQRQATADTVCLQGDDGRWAHLWSGLIEPAEQLGITRIHLDLNLPMLHAGYNGSWQRRIPAEADRAWHVNVPLVLNGTAVGRLEVSGEKNGATLEKTLDPLVAILGSVEGQLSSIVEDAAGG